MNCPRCTRITQEISNANVLIDVCMSGCGGMWFDQFELKKLDEKHEADPSFLQRISSAKSDPSIDLGDPIRCPKCPDQPLFRHFWSAMRKVTVDECPNCAGFWLDAGELIQIHEMFATDADRIKAAENLFNETFGADLENMKTAPENQKSTESLVDRLNKFFGIGTR